MRSSPRLLLLVLILLSGTLRAQVPPLINYQGRVAVDTVNFEGPGQFKFALVNSDGSTTLWSNDGTSDAGSEPGGAVELVVAKGLYSVLLGDTALANMTAIPASAFANPDVRLRVWFDDGVNGSQLLTPDQRLAPSAYLADGAVTTAAIAPAAVTGANVALGALDGTHVATNSLDFSRLSVPAAPAPGQVLGFDGNGLNWTAPGDGDGIWSLNGSSAFYNGGAVGIGTNAPQAKLHLFHPTALSYLIETGGAVNSQAQIVFRNLNGQWVTGTSRGFNNDMFYIDRVGTAPIDFQLSTGGLLGLGIEPQAKLHLFDPANSVSHRVQSGGGTNSWSRIEFANGNGEWHVGTSRAFIGDQLYFARPGGAGIAFAIQPNGDAFLSRNLSIRALTIRGGADLAEPFAMSEHRVPAGAVVSIDPKNAGKLKMSTRAYDKKVAGIVSGANGLHPGISMIDEQQLATGENVALSGRVHVKANSSAGAIEVGDLLTTSDVPGEAMRATNHHRAQGSIIGKAMTTLDEITGTVLVLVTLQ